MINIIIKNNIGFLIMNNISVIIRIKTIYRDMNSTEKNIADYILDNFNDISIKTINEIASELKISDSTLFKFTRKLGFNGFKDFKIAILKEGAIYKPSIHEKISKEDDELKITHKVFESNIKAIEDTKKLIDKELYKNAIKYIIESDRVAFFGLGGSNAVAYDAYHKFLRSPIKCIYVTDFHMQLMNASLLKENDCAIIISHTGLTKHAIEIANAVKKNKAKIIVITSYPLSPLAKLANIVLVSTSDEIAYRSESLSSRLSELTIIDSLFVNIMFKNEKNSNKSLSLIRQVIATTKE